MAEFITTSLLSPIVGVITLDALIEFQLRHYLTIVDFLCVRIAFSLIGGFVVPFITEFAGCGSISFFLRF